VARAPIRDQTTALAAGSTVRSWQNPLGRFRTRRARGTPQRTGSTEKRTGSAIPISTGAPHFVTSASR